MSQTVALEALHRAAYERGVTVLMVSRNLESATNLLRYVKLTLPVAEPTIRIVKDNETEIVLSTQSRIKSVAASRSTGRSYAASHVYLDEFAFMPFALEIYQSVRPTVSRGGTVTILSTPFGQNNPFYLLWQGQMGGSESWSRHTLPWYFCPEFCPPDLAGTRALREQSPWYLTERPQYTAQQWASEYECDFIESGQAVFRPEDIARQSFDWMGLQAPAQGRRYVTGWDIGRRHDATVGVTLDCTTPVHHVVAFERLLGQPYPVIQQAIERRCAQYSGKHVVESNGIGDPVIENLLVRVEPYKTTARSKVQAITALQRAVERSEFKHDIEQLRVEQLVYQWDDDDLTQDCVMAAAIAEVSAGRVRATGWDGREERAAALPIGRGYSAL